MAGLGGRIIARSSSPLEADPRWSGAFSSVAEVGPDDVTAAIRSCWASAFAVDPLKRLDACGLPPEALELGVLLQPEIRPVAGGVARVTRHRRGRRRRGDGGRCAAVIPAPCCPAGPTARPPLSGFPSPLDGAAPLPSRLTWRRPTSPVRHQPGQSGRPDQRSDGGLAALIGTATVAAVADLAHRAWRLLGDDVIEWATDGGGIWLLQSQRSAAGPADAAPVSRAGAGRGAAAGGGVRTGTGSWADELPTTRASMPLLAATVLRRGEHVPGRPGAPGTAAGRLVAVRPHERPAAHCGDAILLVAQPVPALAPLLFAARGVIARTGRRARIWPRSPAASASRWCSAAARNGSPAGRPFLTAPSWPRSTAPPVTSRFSPRRGTTSGPSTYPASVRSIYIIWRPRSCLRDRGQRI